MTIRQFVKESLKSFREKLATVAITNSYNDLDDKPTIPTMPTIPNVTVTSTGSGNAVTSVTASGHAITVKKEKSYNNVKMITVKLNPTETITANANFALEGTANFSYEPTALGIAGWNVSWGGVVPVGFRCEVSGNKITVKCTAWALTAGAQSGFYINAYLLYA